MMTFRVEQERGKTACLVVPLFEGKLDAEAKALDRDLSGEIATLMEMKDFEAKRGQYHMLYPRKRDLPRVLLIGLGNKKELDLRRWKHAVGLALIQVQAKKQTQCSVLIPAALLKLFPAKKLGQETAIALELANYAFDDHKQKDARILPLTSVESIVEESRARKEFAAGAKDGQDIAEGANFTRRLGNTSPSIMTPELLAKETQVAFKGVANTKVTVLGRAEMKKLGMGCLLGVAQGSALEPKFIIIEYRGGKASEKPTVLVGKGITFDSGGLSLKPSQFMSDMKFDMLGAATVAGILKAASRLKVKKNIVGLMPSCENMPSGTSFRPDDILTAMNGKSVLIDNTDAEGRLILCDALCYAQRYEPKEVIDFATLTGACVVALGQERSGLFSPEDSFAEKLLAHAEETGEYLWRLPLGEEFTEELMTPIADIKNVSASRYGGASSAAAFLEYFTKDEKGKPAFPWAHIDMASCYSSHSGKPYMRGGANGFGVQTVVNYLR